MIPVGTTAELKAVTSATKRLGQGLGELKYLYKNQKKEKKIKGRRGFYEQ